MKFPPSELSLLKTYPSEDGPISPGRDSNFAQWTTATTSAEQGEKK